MGASSSHFDPMYVSTAGQRLRKCVMMLGIAFILFNYVADLVLDALTTVFVCYAIARDNQMQSEKLDYLQKLLPKSVIPIVGQPIQPRNDDL